MNFLLKIFAENLLSESSKLVILPWFQGLNHAQKKLIKSLASGIDPRPGKQDLKPKVRIGPKSRFSV